MKLSYVSKPVRAIPTGAEREDCAIAVQGATVAQAEYAYRSQAQDEKISLTENQHD